MNPMCMCVCVCGWNVYAQLCKRSIVPFLLSPYLWALESYATFLR